MRPLRIVHIVASAVGCPWMVGIIREQRRRGHDVTAVIGGADGTLAPIFEAEGIPYLVLPLQRRNTTGVGVHNIFITMRLLRRLRPDVVHYHLYPSIIIGRVSAWLVDAPVRYSMIPGTYYLEAPILGDIEAGTAFGDTRVIATCEKTRSLYAERGTPQEKLEVIYYGLDEALFDPTQASRDKLRDELGIRDDQPLVGNVAYFYAPPVDPTYTPPHLLGVGGLKGHEVLFRAIPRVLEEFPDAKFVLVGKGFAEPGMVYEQQVRALVHELGLDDVVIFTGERTDIPDTLAAFDVSLQCSLCENLGGSIESLMMGKALIASRVGGLVDSVLHEKTGLLVPPRDHEALADAILRLLRDRQLAAQLGAEGRRWMLERFTLRRTVDDLEALYARCFAENGFDARPPREQAYRWSRTVVRLFIAPFRLIPLYVLMQKGRLRHLTLRRVAGRLLAPFRRVLAGGRTA